MRLNKPFKSDKPEKKFQVYARDSKTGKIKHIYFGATGYEDYTMHKDSARRDSFRARHKCDPIRKLNKASARYWACQYLWNKRQS